MTHIWLRAESKPHERRTALTPQHAGKLCAAGFQVTVEKSSQSAFDAAAYQAAGCVLVAEHSWKTDAPADALVVGLKELEVSKDPIRHRHIHFAHAFKEQEGWEKVLDRFGRGGGALYDLEFLTNEQGRRVAAFGYWAGFAGAALAVMGWAGQQNAQTPILGKIESKDSKEALIDDVRRAMEGLNRVPSAMVIGALGRSGRGACEMLASVGIETKKWDLEETKRGGPFAETLEVDLLLNCVFVSGALPPFLTNEMIASPDRRLGMICDVSCDPYGDYNPLPIYDKCTTFDAPSLRLVDGDRPLDLIAIDHLPSLLPVESSEDFCEQLMPHLLQLDRLDRGTWQRAFEIFETNLQAAKQFANDS